MRPAYSLAAGLALAALGILAYFIAAPLPLTQHAASIQAHAFGRLIEPDVSMPAEPLSSTAEFASEVPFSSAPGEGVHDGILLTRECLALAERDPLAAMEMAVARELEKVDSSLPASLMAQWAAKDFDRAYEWTKAQEPGAWRDEILARLAYVRAKTDPVAAARVVATEISASPARDEAVISVIHQWALRDARGAGLWAQSLPDEGLRQRASDEIEGITTAFSAAEPAR